IKALRIAMLLPIGLCLLACSKPALYGTVQEAEPVVKYFAVPPAEAFRAAKESLAFRGYSLKEVDDKNFTLETYWQPTTADSHYVLVFGEPDYGTVSAYYRLAVKVTQQGNGSKVAITNVAKSFISDIKSSHREEDAVFIKVSDFTRKRDIQITNIGLQ
ncbi:MAG: hypothetical protein K8R69_08930, partial [Deltaproteobacteria bacterium]|nr:hypothetical protein [Deltaproteobacteria bacterium]